MPEADVTVRVDLDAQWINLKTLWEKHGADEGKTTLVFGQCITSHANTGLNTWLSLGLHLTKRNTKARHISNTNWAVLCAAG